MAQVLPVSLPRIFLSSLLSIPPDCSAVRDCNKCIASEHSSQQIRSEVPKTEDGNGQRSSACSV